MGLEVIGSGFGRTGTMSLKAALEKLGFGPCHHMAELIEDPARLPPWRAALRGETPDWDAVFADYRSAVDWPAAHYWRALADRYPDAKIVHTTRDPDRWWTSFQDTVGAVIRKAGMGPGCEEMRNVPELIHEMAVRQTFRSTVDDKAAAVAALEARDAEVRAFPDPDRVLVFDVREGWGPLCAFLGVDAPDGPFPHANSTDDFLTVIRAKLAT